MIRQIKLKRKKSNISLVVLLLVIVFIWWHSVPRSSSDADEQAIALFLKANHIEPFQGGDYEAEVAFISSVQHAVIQQIMHRGSIPEGEKRNPAIVLQRGIGECYDRSNLIELILIENGFDTRHVSLYPMQEGTKWEVLTTRQTPSHAASEIKTSKGWMYVDPNTAFVGIDTVKQLPLSSFQIREQKAVQHFPFRSKVIMIYGLYSRHGKFFPPFNWVPDYNFRELWYNLF